MFASLVLLVIVTLARGGGGGGGGGGRGGGVRAANNTRAKGKALRSGLKSKTKPNTLQNFEGRGITTKMRQLQKAKNASREAVNKLQQIKTQSKGFRTLLNRSQQHIERGMQRMYRDKANARQVSRETRKNIDNKWNGDENDDLFRILMDIYRAIEKGEDIYDEVYVELE